MCCILYVSDLIKTLSAAVIDYVKMDAFCIVVYTIVITEEGDGGVLTV